VWTSPTDIETDVVDLSHCGLGEAMTLQDPLLMASLESVVEAVAGQPEMQSAGGTDNPNPSEYFPAPCSGPPR
jgi:hypothetical protein